MAREGGRGENLIERFVKGGTGRGDGLFVDDCHLENPLH
jgi:hypothetical protein